MKKIKISSKNFKLALCFGLVCAIMISISKFNVSCDDLRSNVLRLHIIANSDSVADQDLKLFVRDEILIECGYMFGNAGNLSEAEILATENLPLIENLANNVIKENGFDYTAKVEIGTTFFDTREYDNFTLPAGEYRSIIVRLGAGKGKNWWCVVFPGVCIPTSVKGDLRDTVEDESADIAENPKRYIMRFKSVEIYEKIKNFLK